VAPFRGVAAWRGWYKTELKRDERACSPKRREANPRSSITADAAGYAGVDLGWLHYLDLIGEAVEPVRPSTSEFRHIVLFRDFESYRDYLRDGLATWKDLIRSYRAPVGFFDFDPWDWRGTLGQMKGMGKILARPRDPAT